MVQQSNPRKHSVQKHGLSSHSQAHKGLFVPSWPPGNKFTQDPKLRLTLQRLEMSHENLTHKVRQSNKQDQLTKLTKPTLSTVQDIELGGKGPIRAPARGAPHGPSPREQGFCSWGLGLLKQKASSGLVISIETPPTQ